MSAPVARPAAPVSVSCWGELRGEPKLPGALRVLVGGQAAGGAERQGEVWAACWYAGMSAGGAMRDRVSEHATAEDAVQAVARSPWARKLGARASSRVWWTDRATRLAGRQVKS